MIKTGLLIGGRVDGGVFLAPKGGGNSVVLADRGAFEQGVYVKAPKTYYLGITASGGTATDIERSQRTFGGSTATPRQFENRPADVPAGVADTWYDVTDLVPPFVVEKSGTHADKAGPNCYHAALAAAGYAVEGRYVGTGEFRFILKEDYEIVPPEAAAYGAIVLYYPDTLGEHAAFMLPGGLVFHKGGIETGYSYALVPVDEAIQHARSEWQPAREDRFGHPRNPWPMDSRNRVFYRRKQVAAVESPVGLQPSLARFLPLVEYYCGLLEAVALADKWKTFPNNRIALLTIETMHAIGRDFANTINLKRGPRSILEIHYRFDSLLWQYKEMSKTYGGISETYYERDMRRLYESQYVRFDDEYYRELHLLLAFAGVPEAACESVAARVTERVRQYDPLEFVRYDGSRGIPYLDIIREEAARFV